MVSLGLLLYIPFSLILYQNLKTTYKPQKVPFIPRLSGISYGYISRIAISFETSETRVSRQCCTGIPKALCRLFLYVIQVSFSKRCPSLMYSNESEDIIFPHHWQSMHTFFPASLRFDLHRHTATHSVPSSSERLPDLPLSGAHRLPHWQCAAQRSSNGWGTGQNHNYPVHRLGSSATQLYWCFPGWM